MPKYLIRIVALVLIPCLLSEPTLAFAFSGPSPIHATSKSLRDETGLIRTEAITPFLEWVGIASLFRRLTGRSRRLEKEKFISSAIMAKVREPGKSAARSTGVLNGGQWTEV